MSTPPRSQSVLTSEELAAIAGISLQTLERLVQLGVLEPELPASRDFPAASVGRLRRVIRLHADLHVNLAGAAIIVELMERLEQLEIELDRMRTDSDRRP